ncbi:hypothetical protein ATANTOWER_007152 [Ataeniobius toweri]|uniref:Uncharacterized protein n=1 Tax=Ataeniobius toweri TaxID=208326 RepID=A0ABU7AES2_9TELE|nr:hypothetical protein [Ataeniobius toweri]
MVACFQEVDSRSGRETDNQCFLRGVSAGSNRVNTEHRSMGVRRQHQRGILQKEYQRLQEQRFQLLRTPS